MAKENETVADIIAEKRRWAEEIERDCAEKKKSGDMVSDRYARELVADIRREADRLDAAAKRMEWAHKKELETRDAVIQTEVAAREAEREAHKREKDALQAQLDELRPGIEQYRQYNARVVKEFNSKLVNAAKLREALKLYDRIFQDRTLVCDCDIVNGARALARAALAAPARNCDVGTAEEQGKRFTEFCYKNRNAESCCGDCPAFNKGCFAGCELEWAQMPYEESEAAK